MLLRVIFAIMFAVAVYSPQQPTIEQDYTVQFGDTLWDVMRQKVSNNHDLRQYVYLTAEKNNLEDAKLTPGEKIKLVLPKE